MKQISQEPCLMGCNPLLLSDMHAKPRSPAYKSGCSASLQIYRQSPGTLDAQTPVEPFP